MQIDNNMHPFMMMGREMKCDVFEYKAAMEPHAEALRTNRACLIGILFRGVEMMLDGGRRR